jgi:hypothetical protein
MKKVAPELDDLMWAIAEDGKPQAVAEFEARYPQFGPELARRINMVKGLKGEKRRSEAGAVPSIPRFVPREPRPASPPPRAVAITAGLVLAALAAASFTITSFVAAPPKVVTEPTPAPREPVAVRRGPDTVIPDPVVETPKPELPKPQVADPEPPPTPRYLLPQSVSIKRAPLQTALQMVAMQGGLQLEMAPGMPNPEVAVDYEGKNTIEILEDLGRQYAFTAFDQGNGSVLIIPARDEDQSPTPSSSEGPVNRGRIGP